MEIGLDDVVVKSFLFYTSILVLKTMLMSTLTGLTRLRKKVFISGEDVKLFGRFFGKDRANVRYDDEDVERVRRAHLNDLENILTFIITGFVFVLTKPEEMLAVNLFRIVTVFRLLHTVVYAIFVVPQPARLICYLVPHLIAVYMAFVGIVKFCQP